MANNAVACVERATSDMLIGPDWAVNIELCDIINMEPGQAKDALKLLKKRLGSKSPQILLLALFVLETLSKNCGEYIFQQIVERDILHDMVKIVKKKPDLNVREKILILIDTWQEALGGPRGRHPQYYAAYNELRAAGVDFPPREENVVPLFTPPQTQPISYPAAEDEAAALQASLQSNNSEMSLAEIQNAQGLADVLMEMLTALDPKNREELNQEVIIDLVDQCRSYQTRVMNLVTSTANEELLYKGLALNDDLQRVLSRHDDVAKGTPTVGLGMRENPVAPLMNVNHEDDESEDDLSQLAPRSSRDSLQGQGRKPTIAMNSEPVRTNPLLAPPPSYRKSTPDASMVDFLSGEAYNAERPVQTRSNNTNAIPPPTPSLSSSSSLPSDYVNPTASMFTGDPVTDEPPPKPKSTDAPTFLPPPPAKYNQRQQFFEQQSSPGGASHLGNGSGSSYDGLVGPTRNLSLNPTTPTKQEKQEDALFQDLVDFAKKRSSSSSSKPNRSY